MVAGENSPDLLHYNPAGLTSIDQRQIQSNTIFLYGSTKIEQDSGTSRADSNRPLTGALYYAQPFMLGERKAAFGFGITTPYGQSIEWPSDAPFRDFGYEGLMEFVQFNGGLAVELFPGFSVGGSLSWAMSHLETVSGGGNPLTPTDELDFDGDAYQWGYTLGVAYEPTDQLRIGLSYRSGYDLKHSGSYDYRVADGAPVAVSGRGSTAFQLPDHLTLGVDYEVDERWSVGAQVQWTDWSEMKGFSVDYGILGVSFWHDSFIYSLGTSYKYSKNLTLHAGYMYVEPLIDDVYSGPTVLDFEQHFVSVGLTWVRDDNWTVDASYVHVFSKDNDYEGTQREFDGTAKNGGGFINLGVTRRF